MSSSSSSSSSSSAAAGSGGASNAAAQAAWLPPAASPAPAAHAAPSSPVLAGLKAQGVRVYVALSACGECGPGIGFFPDFDAAPGKGLVAAAAAAAAAAGAAAVPSRKTVRLQFDVSVPIGSAVLDIPHSRGGARSIHIVPCEPSVAPSEIDQRKRGRYDATDAFLPGAHSAAASAASAAGAAGAGESAARAAGADDAVVFDGVGEAAEEGAGVWGGALAGLGGEVVQALMAAQAAQAAQAEQAAQAAQAEQAEQAALAARALANEKADLGVANFFVCANLDHTKVRSGQKCEEGACGFH